MSDGGWYGYPQEPDPYAQPQDDWSQPPLDYSNPPQAPGYPSSAGYGQQQSSYGTSAAAGYGQDPAAQAQYYQQQQPSQSPPPQPQQPPQSGRRGPQQGQGQPYGGRQAPPQPQPSQNPYSSTGRQQGYETGSYGAPSYDQNGAGYSAPPSAPQQGRPYSTGPQPRVGYEGYASGSYEAGGRTSGGYGTSGYETGAGYDTNAGYASGSYRAYETDPGTRTAGGYATGAGRARPRPQGQGRPANPNPYADASYGETQAPYTPYTDLADETPDEYEYPRGRRAARTESAQSGMDREERLNLMDEDDEDEDGGRKGGGGGRSGSGRKERRGKSCLAVFIAFCVIGGLIGYGGYQGYKWYQGKYGPPADFTSSTGIAAEVVVQIPDNATGSSIGQILVQDDVVKSQRAFVNACNANQECASIQANTYQLHKEMSAAAAVTALLDPNNVYNKAQLLVKPGERAADVFKDLEVKTNWTQQQIVAAINGGKVDLPSWATAKTGPNFPFANVEGLLYTTTYQLPTFKDPTALVKSMIDQQLAMFNAVGLTSKAQSLHMTPYQVLTVASMARAEAGSDPADLSKISGVIYNRLKNTDFSKLGFDTATLYGLGRTEPQPTSAELADKANPYNLRVISGLPPGPIDSVDETALTAATAPNDASDMFFCAVNGTIHYAANDTAWGQLGKQFPGYCGD